MAGKPKGAGNEAVLSFRISRELFDRLYQAAAGRSVSEEIRHRLEASFASEASSDEETQQLTKMIGDAASMLARLYLPTWHQAPVVFIRFKRTVEILIEYFKPEGDPSPAVIETPFGPKPINPSPENDATLIAGLALATEGLSLPRRGK